MWNSSRDYANSHTATGPSTPHAVSVVQQDFLLSTENAEDSSTLHPSTKSVCLRRNTNKTGKMKSFKNSDATIKITKTLLQPYLLWMNRYLTFIGQTGENIISTSSLFT